MAPPDHSGERPWLREEGPGQAPAQGTQERQLVYVEGGNKSQGWPHFICPIPAASR